LSVSKLVSRVDDLGVDVWKLRLNSGPEGGEEVKCAVGATGVGVGAWVEKTTYTSL
jgi:hypothetical protein